MQRTLLALTVAALLTVASPVSAQERDSVSRDDSQTLSLIDYRSELDGIAAESTAASVLYTIGGGLLVVSGAIAIGAFAAESSSSSFISPGAVALVLAGPVAGLGLLILIPIGMVLESDAKSRRETLERRAEGLRLTAISATPTQGGAVLQLGGRF